jgi:predicted dehydrogenase
VEKPVYTKYSDFRELIDQGNKQVISRSASGYFWIYKREVEYVKQVIESGKIGEVRSYKISLKHSEVFGPKNGWLFKKNLSGGGVLANPGPHAFSLIQYLFGKGKIVSARTWNLYGNEVEDKAEIKLSHPRAIQGELKANWSIKGYPVMTIEFDIKGSKGSIKFSDNKLVIKTKSKTITLPYYKIPRNHPVFNLNPKSGGDAYYIEDKIYIESLLNKERSSVNNIDFASKVESMISEAYEKAK